MRAVLLLTMAAIFTLGTASAGPLSKFEKRVPISAFETPAKMEDVERCLLDTSNAGLPYVYAQPDRPDDVTIMWNPNMDINSLRIDLHRTERGTKITSWIPEKMILVCAPSRIG